MANYVGGAGPDTLRGGGVDDFIQGAGGNDTLYGGGGDDFLAGDLGDDVLDGEAGFDSAYYWNAANAVQVDLSVEVAQDTGEGLDRLVSIEGVVGSDYDDILIGNALGNILWGNLGSDFLRGGDGDDTLYGEGDDDYLEGGAGADELDGGDGFDSVYFWNALAAIRVDLGILIAQDTGEGFDTLIGIEGVVGSDFDDTLIGNAQANALWGNLGADTLRGGAGDDYLSGDGGADSLDGGVGADEMHGGSQDDTYYVDNVGDRAVEAAGGGSDTVVTAITYTLAAGSEIEIVRMADVASTAALNLTGNAFGNSLFGNAGINRLNGGLGVDEMVGYGGNDFYYVDNVADRVIEQAGGGADTVYTLVSYTLAAGSEIETLATYGSTTTAAINLTGNSFVNKLVGNAAANTLNGGGGADLMWGYAGNDLYFVDHAGDQVFEAVGQGADKVLASVSWTLGLNAEVETLAAINPSSTATINLTGNGFVNRLQGNAGANRLNGGGGADELIGYGGADIYDVDDAGDRVVEQVGGGYDSVYTRVSYVLAAGSEIEVLATYGSATTAVIDLTGNELFNRLVGNAAANRLDGGAGADWMWGNGGDDTFIVDNAADRVFETAGQGTDTILTSVTYKLEAAADVEVVAAANVALATTINLTGNALANSLRGDAGANRLDGGGGADEMIGHAGDDTYFVDNAGDRVIEHAGGGYDTVNTQVSYALAAGSEIEVLATFGSATITVIDLTGNELFNRLVGNAAANRIDGGAGRGLDVGQRGRRHVHRRQRRRPRL
jgi:serralysin